ncbi:MAG: hypothetical protein K2W95_14420 [Candidatus Obscuribacterales bacterium]|nr:hypothetical protein [Candidatus Obscuribacterales bacterium]
MVIFVAGPMVDSHWLEASDGWGPKVSPEGANGCEVDGDYSFETRGRLRQRIQRMENRRSTVMDCIALSPRGLVIAAGWGAFIAVSGCAIWSVIPPH